MQTALPTFMTIPAEVRVKIYGALFEEIKIKQTLERRPVRRPFSRPYRPPYRSSRVSPIFGDLHDTTKEIVHCTFRPRHPFAILQVSKKVREQAHVLATICPVHLEIAGYPLGSDLTSVRLPSTARLGICSLVVDSSPHFFEDIDHFLDKSVYPNLRSIEFRKEAPRVQSSDRFVHVLFRLGSMRLSDNATLFDEIGGMFGPERLEKIASGAYDVQFECTFTTEVPNPKCPGGRGCASDILATGVW